MKNHNFFYMLLIALASTLQVQSVNKLLLFSCKNKDEAHITQVEPCRSGCGPKVTDKKILALKECRLIDGKPEMRLAAFEGRTPSCIMYYQVAPDAVSPADICGGKDAVDVMQIFGDYNLRLRYEPTH